MTVNISLASLNQMSADKFTAALQDVYEHSAWIPEKVYSQRPFDDIEALHQAMMQVVKRATAAEQLVLLRAHPELAGREAQQGELTTSSSEEQASAGLNALSSAEIDEVKRLNADYKNKFGFPFIIAVRSASKAEIFSQWAGRLNNSPEAELETCLQQVYLIANFRLQTLIQC